MLGDLRLSIAFEDASPLSVVERLGEISGMKIDLNDRLVPASTSTITGAYGDLMLRGVLLLT